MSIISAKDFSCYYKVKRKYVRALDSITFSVEPNDFVVLIGQSGSGKSTFIKSILGLCDLVEGELLINGFKVDDFSVKKQNFAYISQDAVLFPHMTIYENLLFPLKSTHLTHAERDNLIKEIAEDTDIALFLTRKPKQLSGGQQQKVAIAKALVKHPTVLLLDEPLAHIDGPAQKSLLETISHVYEKYKPTVIYSTHDLNEAFSIGNKIMSLENGKIVEFGLTKDILANPKSELAKLYKQTK